MRWVSANPIAEYRYRGKRPISSLKEVVTRGTTAKPSVYNESPIVAWKDVQFRSRILEENPRLYVEAAAANV